MSKKVALVGFRLNKGGAERVMATLSTFFENNGLEVHIIVVLDDIAYEHSGKVFNLGKLKNRSNGLINKVKRLVALTSYFRKHKFDFIIDFRFRVKPIQELLIAKYIYNAKTIFTVHSSSLNNYIPDFTLLARLIYANCYSLIAISESMKYKIKVLHGFDNVKTIYNPVNIEIIDKKSKIEIEFNDDYIISVGELNTGIKQFDKLIDAYSRSILPKKNIALVVLGEGVNLDNLKKKAVELGVSNLVHFLGFKENPFKYMRRAKFFVLSSKFEGLPMVIIEALACGTPVVAFDCPTGPKEIIIHKENGLLIEDQNIEALVLGINEITTNTSLYSYCKSNALSSIDKFSVKVIGKQWLELMNINPN